MTVNMSSEGDSAKNLSSESNEKSEAENTDSSQDAKDAKSDIVTENSVEKKEDESKPKDADKESSDEADKKSDSNKASTGKGENSKGEVKTSDKKEKNKAKEEEEDEDSEQDGEGSEKGDEDEKEVPLLDQPLEKSGKRERKNVERFKEDFSEASGKVEFVNGPGISLGNIPRIDASISRFKNDDMKVLHRILFKTPGKSTMVKKNIKRFNGFDFKQDSEEYTKKIAAMNKCDLKSLKSICEMLDLMKTGTKDDIIERILQFLLDPKDSGKPVGGGRPKRTAAVKANNRGYSSHDNYSSDERHSRTGRDKGRRTNLKDDSSSASDEDFEPSDEGSDEKPAVKKRRRPERKKVDSEDEASEIESGSSEDSEYQDEPKAKRKKSTKANNKSKGKTPNKKGKKQAAAKKTPKGGKKKNKSSDEEDGEEEESDHKEEEGSSSEDEPLAKKASKSAQPPTDEEIKSYVKEILEGANLEQITMKTVCQQVYAHYPDFDLAHKKDFIKTTVKSLIST